MHVSFHPLTLPLGSLMLDNLLAPPIRESQRNPRVRSDELTIDSDRTSPPPGTSSVLLAQH